MATNEEVMVYFKGVDNVSNTAQNIKKNVTGIGDSASGVRGKISGIANNFDVVSSAITGVLGGMNLLNQATNMWEAATQRQSSQFYLQHALDGTGRSAQEVQRQIQGIVATVPGDDSFMNVILTGAVAKQTDITTDKLQEGANAIADYMMASEMNGKNAIETQQDLKTYILTGNTATLERDSILKEQLGTLEGQATITDRINALNQALNAEQYKGMSSYDTASNAMAEFQGRMEKAYADLGSMFLPTVQGILQGFLDIDEGVSGGLSMAIVGVGTALSGVATGIGAVGTAFTGINSMIQFWDTLSTAIKGVEVAEEGLEAASTATAAATTLLGEASTATALAEAGLTAEEVGAAGAHAGNIVSLEAEGLAAAESSAGFWALAAAEIASLWPILAIAAAVAALIVVVEQIGESLGWWTDFSTMLDAIKAGVERLWNAFINSPQVQGTLSAIQGAFQSLMSALQPVFNWLTAAWNDLFKSEGAGTGGPDIVRSIIDIFGQLGNIAGTVFGYLQQGFQTIGNIAGTVFGYLQQGFQTIAYLVDPILQIFSRFLSLLFELADGSTSFDEAIVSTFNSVLTGLLQFGYRFNQIALQIGRAILTALINALRPLPGRIWNFLIQGITRFIQFRTRIAQIALQAGLRVLTALTTYLRQLPGRVWSYMLQVPGRITSAAGAAVGAAASLASQVVQAVTNGVVGVAEHVYNEFMAIPDRINGAVSAAASAAANFGSGIKDAVLKALHIASPGIIQRKIAIEFADIPGRIGESQDYVYGAARDYAGNILRGFNAPQMSLSSMGVARQNINYIPKGNTGKNVTIIHVHEGAVPIDARNMNKREAQGIITLAFENIFKNPNAYGG